MGKESDYEGQVRGQEVGLEIQRLRKAAEMSLDELSERSGVSKYAIRNLEGGLVSRPKAEVVKRVMEVLGVDLR